MFLLFLFPLEWLYLDTEWLIPKSLGESNVRIAFVAIDFRISSSLLKYSNFCPTISPSHYLPLLEKQLKLCLHEQIHQLFWLLIILSLNV